MKLLGQMLIENNLISPEQLEEALEEQKKTGELLGDILVKLGMVSRTDLFKIKGFKKLLGEVLLENKMINREQLAIALKEQKGTGEILGDVLIRLGMVSRRDLSWAVAFCSDLPFVNLKEVRINPNAVSEVPKDVAKKYKLIPFAFDENTLQVAMDNPNNVVAIDALRRLTKKNIDVFASDFEGVLEAIELYYEVGASIEEEIKKNIEAAVSGGGAAEGESAPPIVRLVELFLIQGIRDGATDVHITPEEKIVRVSYRIDGILRSDTVFPKGLHAPIVTRVKVMSGLNIAEQRLPQEGHLTFSFSGRQIDIRSSTSPCDEGENIVLRILDKANIIVGLNFLGLEKNDHITIQRLTKKPHGIILSAGPTGSGKTTTLYSMLKEINAMEKNILTIEDPIEYHIPLIKQTQVNEQAELTFNRAIRSFLRQDPDVILVGEIRDLETAQIAFQAAMTGHLVLSTLHTNDAASTVARLLDLGVEAYLIPSSLRAIIAQRLLRRICDDCTEEYRLSEEELALYDLQDWQGATKSLRRGKGCEKCGHTGYRGRTGIFEILEITPDISSLINEKAPADIIEAAAIKEGMVSMRQDGLNKVLQGITTVEEVYRVA